MEELRGSLLLPLMCLHSTLNLLGAENAMFTLLCRPIFSEVVWHIVMVRYDDCLFLFDGALFNSRFSQVLFQALCDGHDIREG